MSIIDINSSLSILNGISILSYNILLPNSIGGWWVYKMYSHRHSININYTKWEYRQNLIKKDIIQTNCDIICLQEVYPESFLNDFNFMNELGYDRYEIYRKGEFRPAIFWKSSKLMIDSEPMHRDRCLIIPFRLISNSSNSSNSSNDNNNFTLPLYVCNCHLQAGIENSERRFRQVHDSLETIRKHATKLISLHIEQLRKESKRKKNEPKITINSNEITNNLLKTVPIVLCGDMNCNPDDLCGSHSLLIYGEATVEGKIINETLPINKETGKQLSIKKHPFETFIDTYDMVYRKLDENSLPPPTMIVEELYEVLTTSDINLASSISTNLSYNSTLKQYNLYLTSLALERLTSMFDKYAQTLFPTENDPKLMVMSTEDIKRWLVDINKEWTRGSEYHASKQRIKLFPDVTNNNNNNNNNNEHENNVTFPEEVKIEIQQNKNEESNDNDNDNDNNDNGDNNDKMNDLTPRSFPDNCYLTYLDFCSIYEQVITEGKVWAVSHDMAICGFPLPITSNVYTARYDRIYISGSLQSNLQLVRDIPCGSIDEGCPGIGGCLPNALYPSDHFPVAIALTYPN